MKNSDLVRVLSGHDYWAPEPYHRDANSAYQQYGASEALLIAVAGLSRFPYNIDLLIDALNWSPISEGKESSDGTVDANIFLVRLVALKDRWTKIAYESVISLYLRRVSALREGDAENCFNEAQKIADEYIKAFPNEERSYLTYAQVMYSKDRYSNSKDSRIDFATYLSEIVRHGGINGQLTNTIQCSLECAKALMQEGEYRLASGVAMAGLSSCVTPEATEDMEELALLLLLSIDANILGEIGCRDGFQRSGSELKMKRQIELYEVFLAAIPEDSRSAKIANIRRCIYKILLNENIGDRSENFNHQFGTDSFSW